MKLIFLFKKFFHFFLRPKSIRLGISLFSGAFKAIFFEHKKYVFFCLMACALEVMVIFTFIGQHFRFDYFFLNISQLDDVLISILSQLFIIPLKSRIILINLIAICFIIYFKNVILYAATHYTLHIFDYTASHGHSLRLAFGKKIIVFSCLEIAIYSLQAALGNWAIIVQLPWALISFFIIPQIVVSKKYILFDLYQSTILFLKRIGSIISAEFLFESVLYIVSWILYQQYTFAEFWNKEKLIESLSITNSLLIMVILYGSSIIIIAQTILITYLYLERPQKMS